MRLTVPSEHGSARHTIAQKLAQLIDGEYPRLQTLGKRARVDDDERLRRLAQLIDGEYPRLQTLGKRARVHDDERLSRARQRDVQLAQAAVAALLRDRGRLDNDDMVEFQAFRFARRQHRHA